jgi:AraC-like DNA-binding protein/mannose-6-phosphate isomerase-like protein (cupin superfamily)
MKKNLEYYGKISTDDNRHELLPHGTPRFRMSVHLTKVPFGSSQVLYSHWHDELEFLFFSGGQARVQIGKDAFIVKENDIVIIQPNMLHSADRINKSPCEFFAILVHYNFLASLETDDVQLNYVLPFFSGHIAYPVHIKADMDKQYNLLGVLGEIISAFRTGEQGYEIFIKSKFYEVIYIILKYASLYANTPSIKKTDVIPNAAWIANFLQYMQENFYEHITLADIAEKVNMSEGHLCREVKRIFGLTPLEFLNNYRISKAVHLIETTNRSLGEISDETGFPNINRFTSTFKKTFNCTPIHYRMKLRH